MSIIYTSGGAVTVADATTTVSGKVRLATTVEAGGTSEAIAVTPAGLQAEIAGMVSGTQYKGAVAYDAIATTLVNAVTGDMYRLSSAGTAHGETWTIGDLLIVNANMGGTFDAAKINRFDTTDSDLATVATSGSYNDLSNKPTIPANSTDLGDTANLIRTSNTASQTAAGIVEIATNAETTTGTSTTLAVSPAGLANELGSYTATSSLATVATSGSYNDLSNKPTIPTNSTDLGDTANLIRTSNTASQTAAGIVEIATNAETTTGTSTTLAVSPAGLANELGSYTATSSLATVATSGSYNDLSNKPTIPANSTDLGDTANLIRTSNTASQTAAGIVEIATNAETTTGTSTTLAVSPAGLANELVGHVQYVGNYNASADSPSLVNTKKGDLYKILTGGTRFGRTWVANDHLLINEDMGGVISNGKIDKIDNASSGGASELNDLSDVVITSASTGHVLRHNNSEFVNVQLAYSDLSGTPTLATVATSGSYNDLSNKPTIPTNSTDLGDTANLIRTTNTASQTAAGIVEIATNAETTTGTSTTLAVSPASLANELGSYTATSSLATVATSGSYNDLSNKPTIPTNSTDLGDTANLIRTTNTASQTAAGIVEIATNAETTTGTSTTLAVSPASLANELTTYLENLSEDSTPSLGGDLDVGSSDIISSSNANIEFAANGTGVVKIKPTATGGHLELNGDGTNAGKLRLMCEQSSHGIYLQSPAYSASANYTLTFPTALGNANDVLKTDASGNLSWVAQSSGGSAPSIVSDTSGTNTTISTHSGTEEVHLISNGSNAVTITLPSAGTSGTGYKYQIKRLGSANVTVSATIDGGSSFVLATQYDSVTLISNGTQYYII